MNGFLNYKPETHQNGERVYAGYVEATNILKVDRFSKLSEENPIDKKLESAME